MTLHHKAGGGGRGGERYWFVLGEKKRKPRKNDLGDSKERENLMEMLKLRF